MIAIDGRFEYPLWDDFRVTFDDFRGTWGLEALKRENVKKTVAFNSTSVA